MIKQNVPAIFLSVLLAVLAMLTGWPADSPPTPALAQVSNPAPLPNISQVALGYNHTCALTTTGGVKCWGNNDAGQLGDGTTSSKSTPSVVSGLSSGVTAITAGGDHTCALTTAGGVKCWGAGGHGELGIGSWADEPTPVDVVGLSSGVKAIGAGVIHTCALLISGGVKCWGYNFDGQLGIGTGGGYRGTPADVSTLSSGVTALSVGGYFTCALTTSGGVKCWGDNGWGQLGIGSENSQATPVDVSGLTSGVKAIMAGGHHACALLTGGGAKCWGYNGSGQLGTGTTDTVLTPIDVSSFASGISSLVLGEVHTCALTTSGGVKCAGDNANGQLGDGTTTNQSTPTNVSGLTSGVGAVSAGRAHTCAVTTAGNVKCWGSNDYGQLGDGTDGNKSTPVDVSGLSSGVKTISAGGGYTCILTTTGGVQCWGANDYGQLGDGTTNSRSTPGVVSGVSSGVTAITAGGNHACALTASGGVKCWGRGSSGELGDGTWTTRSTPADVSGLTSGVVAISAGEYHTCALTTSGGVKCWGDNLYGQIGTGGGGGTNTPVDVTGLSSSVAALTSGGSFNCVLTTSGGAKCWGDNGWGQLGIGSDISQASPVDVSGLTSGVSAISAGGHHACALITGGGVKCWGYNNQGQVGSGSMGGATSTPIAVSGLTSGISALTTGALHTCALTTTGGVKCWGRNYNGQLGDGTVADKSTPTTVSGLSSGGRAISAGGAHTCAVMTTGNVKCWGANTYGQLGNGNAWRTTPVAVVESTVSLQPTSQLTQQAGYTQTCATATTPYVKTCTLSFTLKNTNSGMLQIRYYRINALSASVAVLNGSPNPGGVGATLTAVRSVAPNATFQPTFSLGLKSNTSYTLRFSVYGYPGDVVAAGAGDAPANELGVFEATVTPDGAFNSFLPVVQR
ncbi:MAG: hypothetical protein U0350_10270 [Caldilineaceae bacterium]